MRQNTRGYDDVLLCPYAGKEKAKKKDRIGGTQTTSQSKHLRNLAEFISI